MVLCQDVSVLKAGLTAIAEARRMFEIETFVGGDAY